MNKFYLGDGAYVEFDGYGLWLTAENGIEVTNRIYFEPQVLAAFEGYVKRLKVSASAEPDLPPSPNHVLGV